MRYYVAADIHGFYSLLRSELEQKGFFSDPEPHKLLVLGDILDRGREPREMQDFMLRLLAEDRVILVRGNHEDLFADLVTVDGGLPVRHHVSNGTYGSLLSLTGFEETGALERHAELAAAGRETPFYRTVIPATVDWYETERYLFVHGWVPCLKTEAGFTPLENWRAAGKEAWRKARWYNGMDAVRSCRTDKTVLCGHWNCSYGHARYEMRGSEFGPDADYSPYFAPGIIAMDACTAHSGQLNVLVLEDGEGEAHQAGDGANCTKIAKGI